MINKLYKILLLFLLTLLGSCSTMKKPSKAQFSDGFYKHISKKEKQLVYVEISTDTLTMYATEIKNNETIADTIPQKVYLTNPKGQVNGKSTFSQNTLDIDFLTILLKFRPAQGNVKPQLNANINAAVYCGYRTDKYIASYSTNPLNKSTLNISHYGFSIGIFSGIGNTAMSPTTTNNRIQEEYDGIVWAKGIAGIIAINNFTAGITVGFDNLLDDNNNKWIYESKPWLGLALGLNLN